MDISFPQIPYRSWGRQSHPHCILFSLNPAREVCFAAVYASFLLDPTSHPSITSSHAVQPGSIWFANVISVCLLLYQAPPIPPALSFLRRLRTHREGLPCRPTVVNKSFTFDFWIIERTTYYSLTAAKRDTNFFFKEWERTQLSLCWKCMRGYLMEIAVLDLHQSSPETLDT